MLVNEDLEASTQSPHHSRGGAAQRDRLRELDGFVADLQNQIDAL